MTKLLAGRRIFAQDPFVLVDVGALGGIQEHYASFGEDLRVIAFEPNEAECRRLQAQADPRVTYLPYGLGARDETRTLYISSNPSASSIFPLNRRFAERFIGANSTVGEEKIALRRIDDVLKDVGNVDFIKLDAEGAELEIMSAGEAILSRSDMLGLFTEIRWHSGIGTPVFSEVDLFVRRFGYELYDLELGRTSRKGLPYPLTTDFRHDTDSDKKIFGATIQGQVLGGDALYLRDVVAALPAKVTATKILKLACLFEIFEQCDSAAELILAFKDELRHLVDPQELIQAMVPPFQGEAISYDDYMRMYFAHHPELRTGKPITRTSVAKPTVENGMRTKTQILRINLSDPGQPIVVTGIGFKPCGLMLMGSQNGTPGMSFGMADADGGVGYLSTVGGPGPRGPVPSRDWREEILDKARRLLGASAATPMSLHQRSNFETNNRPLMVVYDPQDSRNSNFIFLGSYDSDGFTLMRTKNGSPHGEVAVMAMCFG